MTRIPVPREPTRQAAARGRHGARAPHGRPPSGPPGDGIPLVGVKTREKGEDPTLQTQTSAEQLHPRDRKGASSDHGHRAPSRRETDPGMRHLVATTTVRRSESGSQNVREESHRTAEAYGRVQPRGPATTGPRRPRRAKEDGEEVKVDHREAKLAKRNPPRRRYPHQHRAGPSGDERTQ